MFQREPAQPCSHYRQIPKNARSKQRVGAGVSQDLGRRLAQFAVDFAHLFDVGLVPDANQSVREFAKNTPHRAAVNIGVRAIEIA